MLPFSRLHSQDFPGQSLDFLPERWLDSAGALIKEPRLFIPFSKGIRHCIGWRLAMDESKVCRSLLTRCPSACRVWLLEAADQGPHLDCFMWRSLHDTRPLAKPTGLDLIPAASGTYPASIGMRKHRSRSNTQSQACMFGSCA